MFSAVKRPSEASHLVKRFFWSLSPPTINAREEAWLLQSLSRAERDLYRSMDPVDRAHAVHCAAEARRALGADTDPEVFVASALHDVGKVESGLGTWARVGATLVGIVVPDRMVTSWRQGSGIKRRVADYLAHPEIGAEMLSDAGSSDLAVNWAREHHWADEKRTLDPAIAKPLAAADS